MLKKLDSAKHEAEKNKKDERFANELLKKAKDLFSKGQLADAVDILSIGGKELTIVLKAIKTRSGGGGLT